MGFATSQNFRCGKSDSVGIKCRLYPALAGYTTRYIPRERARSSEVEESARAKPEALPSLHESASPFPRDITGRTSRQNVI